MTDPPDPAPDAVTDGGATPDGDPAPAIGLALDADGQPVLGAFSLDGRAVPALFLVGWVGSLMGGATILVSFFAAGTVAARWLFLAGLVVLGLGLFAAAGSQAVEGARRPSRPYHGPAPVLAFLAVIALSLLVLVIVIAPLSALGLDPASPVGTALSLALTTAMYLLVIRLLVVGPGALSWRDLGLAQPARVAVREALTGALLAVPVLVVTLILTALLTRFLAPAPSPLPPAGNLGGLIMNLLSAGVLAPIGEELFFRGFATTAWARSIGTNAAIIRGAIFFAFAHIVTLFAGSFSSGAQLALFEFVALLPAGMALGWVFLARRSLYASIGLHAAFNAIQVVMLFLAVGVS